MTDNATNNGGAKRRRTSRAAAQVAQSRISNQASNKAATVEAGHTNDKTTKVEEQLETPYTFQANILPPAEDAVFLTSGSAGKVQCWEARDVFNCTVEHLGVYKTAKEAQNALQQSVPKNVMNVTNSSVSGHVVTIPGLQGDDTSSNSFAAVLLLAVSSGPVIDTFDSYDGALSACEKLRKTRLDAGIGSSQQAEQAFHRHAENENSVSAPVPQDSNDDLEYSAFNGSWVARGGGHLIVGIEIRVLWPIDQNWYDGQIIKYNPNKKTHTVLYYSDGAVEELNLRKEKVELPNYRPGSRHGAMYTTVEDDSLAELAKRFNVDLQEFTEINAAIHPAIQARQSKKSSKVVFQQGTRLFLPLPVDGRWNRED